MKKEYKVFSQMIKCEGFIDFLNFFPKKWVFKDLNKLFSNENCGTFNLANCISTFMIDHIAIDLWYHHDTKQFWFEELATGYQSDNFNIIELKNIIKLAKYSGLEDLKNFI